MALLPKISINVSNTGNKADVWEKTGVYSSGNTTGWGSTNPDASDITSADIKIYDYLGTTLMQTIAMVDISTDIYATVSGVSYPTPPSFKAYSDIPWVHLDGVYKIVYSITTTGPVTVVNDCQYSLFTVNLCNCMQGLLVKMATICSGEKLDKYKQVYDQLEIFKYGIETAFSNADFVKVNTLLTEASKLCTTFSDCGCGCDDC
jgi:hypothetical protein